MALGYNNFGDLRSLGMRAKCRAFFIPSYRCSFVHVDIYMPWGRLNRNFEMFYTNFVLHENFT